MKILILKPSSLGDVIHALPVLRLLKAHRPEAEVCWWIEAGLRPLLADDPDLAHVFPFHRDRWAAPGHWGEIARVIRGMRARSFDVAIDLQGLARSALFTWAAGAALKIGFDNAPEGSREGARAAYDLVPPPLPPGSHAVDRCLSVLPLLGVPVHRNFVWLPERPRVAAQLRDRWPVAGARWITLLPGARWDNKRWPVGHFQELTRLLLAALPDVKISILGGKVDAPLGAAIASIQPERCLDLCGRTSLPEMVEWLRLSELVITNDTGPMHVAAALGRPVIALFGPTAPSRTGPYGAGHDVMQVKHLSCVPCLKSRCTHPEALACLHSLTPASVSDLAVRRLGMAAR